MEPTDYKKIIETYFEGLTSLEEERKLKNFLKHYIGNDPLYLELKQLLKKINEIESETCTLNFDDIFQQTEGLIQETQQVGNGLDNILTEVQQQPVSKPKGRLYKTTFFWSGTAAAALLILAWILIKPLSEKTVVYAYINGKPVTNKEIALKYSEQALVIMAKPLQTGTKSLNHFDKLNKPAELLTIQN